MFFWQRPLKAAEPLRFVAFFFAQRNCTAFYVRGVSIHANASTEYGLNYRGFAERSSVWHGFRSEHFGDTFSMGKRDCVPQVLIGCLIKLEGVVLVKNRVNAKFIGLIAGAAMLAVAAPSSAMTVEDLLKATDTNGDGVIQRDEYVAWCAHKGAMDFDKWSGGAVNMKAADVLENFLELQKLTGS